MKLHRILFSFIASLLFAMSASAQAKITPKTPAPEEAIETVFKILSKQESQVPAAQQITELLQKGAWEALAYVNAAVTDSLTKADLQEAVPDYYRFYNNQLLLKLINQEDYNAYGTEASVPYAVKVQTIEILDPDTGTAKDKWQILYLDQFYLALDYGDLRVFFVQTPVQE